MVTIAAGETPLIKQYNNVLSDQSDQTKLENSPTQSTENMLIDAANVDPFLEGRRPRHVWSHQLRLRPTAGSAEHDRNGNGGAFVSCLGPSGEQALFESLLSGAEGAFVAWVKGGHETRQECKRLVVDVLDLLAAPGGQIPAFFQRGALARRPPGGRVGIAANTTSKTVTLKSKVTAPAVLAVEEGSGDGLLPCSAVSSGDSHPTLAENGELNKDVEVAGTNVHASTDVDGNAQEGEQDRAEQTKAAIRDVEDGGRKNAAAEKGGAPELTYGYASLRKIREREPLPEVYHDYSFSEKGACGKKILIELQAIFHEKTSAVLVVDCSGTLSMSSSCSTFQTFYAEM